MKQITLMLLLTSCVRIETKKEEKPRLIQDVENTERNKRICEKWEKLNDLK